LRELPGYKARPAGLFQLLPRGIINNC